MPSKEEIEQAKKEILASITDPLHGTMYCQEDVKNASEVLLKYANELENKIEQLEAEKTAVINKTETKIEELEDTLDLCEADGKIAKYKMKNLKEEISDLKEILELMKGEKK